MHRSFSRAIAWALGVMAVAWALLGLSFWLPSIDLGSPFSAWVVAWANTADVACMVLIGVVLIGLLISRAGLSWRRRLQEIAIHIVVLALLQGGGALINEVLLKPSLAVYRPNIVWLAEEGALGMTAEEFYASMDKHQRQAALEGILTDPDFDAIVLDVKVRNHWIHETGFSMPSGHTFSALLFATYFLAISILLLGDRRRWIFMVLPWWAVGVGWSRVLLRVHRPEDIVLGGLLGMALGLVAIALSYWLLRTLTTSTESQPR